MKFRFFAHLAVLAAAVHLVPSASATWSGFHSLGKTPVVGEPSCAQLAASEVMCVARSQTSTLMANEFSKGAWSGWSDLSAAVTSDPSCVNDEAGNIICAARSTSYTLAATVFDGKSWSSLVDSGEPVFSGTYGGGGVVSCALLGAGEILCAARSQTASLVAARFNGTTWGKFSTAMTSVTSAPGCSNDDKGDVICIANAIVNGGNSTVVNRFDGARWNGLLNLAQSAPSNGNPVCAALGGGSFKGHELCIGIAWNSNAAFASFFNGGIWQGSDWSGFGQMTGNIEPVISCGLLSPGSITCAAINLQDAFLYEDTFNGSNWTGYVKVGGPPLVTGPSCTPFTSGKVMCVVVGLNNEALSVSGP
jgi:hypothetical protein